MAPGHWIRIKNQQPRLDIQAITPRWMRFFWRSPSYKTQYRAGSGAGQQRGVSRFFPAELKSTAVDDFLRQTVSEYHELQRALLLARSLSGVAESHGILCGLLCSGATLGLQSWLDHVLGNEGSGCDIPQESFGLLAQIAEQTVRAMDDPDLPFLPVLPDDDEPICERAAALVEWCEGFLFGFGMNADLSELSQEVGEFVSDLKEITRMDVLSPEDDEENEDALNELVEYIKIGTLIVREEVRAPKPGTRTLH